MKNEEVGCPEWSKKQKLNIT